MYLIIRKGDRAVVGTNYTEPPDGAYNPDLFDVVFWNGPEPPLHNPEGELDPDTGGLLPGVESYDPTIGLAPDDPRLVSVDDQLTALERRVEALEVSVSL
jgi:hypothetical protein